MTNKLHKGHRHSFLKAVEIALNSGHLGDGETSDLLDICQALGFHHVPDVRLDSLLTAIFVSRRPDRKVPSCPRCECAMYIGQAIKCDNDTHGRRVCSCFARPVITAETLELIDCWKCPKCGHSEDIE